MSSKNSHKLLTKLQGTVELTEEEKQQILKEISEKRAEKRKLRPL
jgi:hypothetical protein